MPLLVLLKLLGEISGSLAAECTTVVTSWLLTLSAVQCWAGSIQFIYQRSLPETTLMRTKAVKLWALNPKQCAERHYNPLWG